MNEKEIIEYFREEGDKVSQSEKIEPSSEHKVVGNSSKYGYSGSENFEHDGTGSAHNRSGVEDEINSANAEHEAP